MLGQALLYEDRVQDIIIHACIRLFVAAQVSTRANNVALPFFFLSFLLLRSKAWLTEGMCLSVPASLIKDGGFCVLTAIIPHIAGKPRFPAPRRSTCFCFADVLLVQLDICSSANHYGVSRHITSKQCAMAEIYYITVLVAWILCSGLPVCCSGFMNGSADVCCMVNLVRKRFYLYTPQGFKRRDTVICAQQC